MTPKIIITTERDMNSILHGDVVQAVRVAAQSNRSLYGGSKKPTREFAQTLYAAARGIVVEAAESRFDHAIQDGAISVSAFAEALH